MAQINLGKVVPEKGIDYYTEAEKAALKQELLNEINTDFVKNTDYATASKAGVVKVDTENGIHMTEGKLDGAVYDYNGYKSKANRMLVSKGTLENVIAGKNLETADNKVTELDENSTDTQYPSAKSVYTELQENYKVINKLKEEIQDLEKNQLTGQSIGQSIYLSDSADSRVRSIGLSGNSEQESTTGKNKISSVPFIRNAYISADGVVMYTSEVNEIDIYKADCEQEKTYTVSFINQNLQGTFRIHAYNNDDWISQVETIFVSSNSEKYTKTITTPTNANNIRISFYLNIKEFQLEQGSTATSYEPYTGGQASPNPSYPQEIHSTGDSGSVNEKVQNKNLLDLSKNKDYAYLCTSEFANDILSITVTDATAPYVQYTQKIKKGIYLFYFDTKSSTSDGFAQLGISNAEPTKYGNNIINYKAFEVLEDGKLQIRFQAKRQANAITEFKNVMLKKINSLTDIDTTDYTAHEEQSISFPLSQGQKLMQGDYLADDGIHHKMKEITLDGVTDGLKFTTAELNRNNRFRLNLSDIKQRTYTENTYIKNSHFVYEPTVYYDSQDKIGFCVNSLTLFVRFGSSSEINTITKANNWLAQQYTNGTPVKVQYELATEVIDPYTEEQQAVWEQIKALRTYKPVTHISSEDEVPATVDITYVKDLETVINNLS